MPKKWKQIKKRTKLAEDDRIIDLLERIGVIYLYLSTNLGQNSVARILRMSDGRVNEILKGIKKPAKNSNVKVKETK